MSAQAPITIRPARLEEAGVIADLWLGSRAASIPANPPPVHSGAEVHEHIAQLVGGEAEVFVAEHAEEGVVGLLVLRAGWVDDLHVDPAQTGRGVGSVLVAFAKRHSSGALDLWTFQSNLGARRFYERHGFVAVEMTEGDNEEGEPDVHYRWPAPETPR